MAYLPGQQYVRNAAGVWTSVGYGATDLGVPITDVDTIVLGTISATDAVVAAPAGAGAMVTGASTAGSLVSALSPGGDSSWIMTFTGAFGGGTIYFEESVDSTTGTDGNWIAVNGRQTGVVNTVVANGTATTNTFWRGNSGGAKYLRARIVGATTPSVTVNIRESSGVGPILLGASLPAGTNNVGTVNVNPAAPGTLGSASGNIGVPAYLSIATVTATALVAAPGAGLSIYVTDMEGSNAAVAATRADFTEGVAGTVRYSRFMAASGGGFVTNLGTPWKLPANTALALTQSAANQGFYTANYYVAP